MSAAQAESAKRCRETGKLQARLRQLTKAMDLIEDKTRRLHTETRETGPSVLQQREINDSKLTLELIDESVGAIHDRLNHFLEDAQREQEKQREKQQQRQREQRQEPTHEVELQRIEESLDEIQLMPLTNNPQQRGAQGQSEQGVNNESGNQTEKSRLEQQVYLQRYWIQMDLEDEDSMINEELQSNRYWRDLKRQIDAEQADEQNEDQESGVRLPDVHQSGLLQSLPAYLRGGYQSGDQYSELLSDSDDYMDDDYLSVLLPGGHGRGDQQSVFPPVSHRRGGQQSLHLPGEHRWVDPLSLLPPGNHRRGGQESLHLPGEHRWGDPLSLLPPGSHRRGDQQSLHPPGVPAGNQQSGVPGSDLFSDGGLGPMGVWGQDDSDPLDQVMNMVTQRMRSLQAILPRDFQLDGI